MSCKFIFLFILLLLLFLLYFYFKHSRLSRQKFSSLNLSVWNQSKKKISSEAENKLLPISSIQISNRRELQEIVPGILETKDLIEVKVVRSNIYSSVLSSIVLIPLTMWHFSLPRPLLIVVLNSNTRAIWWKISLANYNYIINF